MIGPEPSLVWGWPRRGLGSNYKITGYTPNAFRDCQSWLIDLGLPSISLTPAEITEATANGYTWQNYGHVSGGYVYGVDLQQNGIARKDTFIHVDDDGRLWRVRLGVSFSGDTATITCTFKRFGEFGNGEQSSQAVFKDVDCDDITPTASPVVEWSIADVKTNGVACLVEVRVVTSGIYKDIYSVIELTPTITSGVADFSAVEIRGGSDTTSTTAEPARNDYAPTVPYVDNGAPCGSPPNGGGTPWYLFGSNSDARYAVSAYYDSTGAARLVRLRSRQFTDMEWGGYTQTDLFTPDGSGCGSYGSTLKLTGVIVSGPQLIIEVDGVELVKFSSLTRNTEEFNCGGVSSICTNYSGGTDCTDLFASSSSIIGSIRLSSSTNIASETVLGFGSGQPSSHTDIINGIRSRTYLLPVSTSTNLIDLSSTVIGTCGAVFAPPSLLALWYKPTGSDVVLSTWAAPMSATYTGSLATVPSVYWAWNRKTNAYTFSILPVCYV
jgi:hypothetical protein